MPEAEVSRQLQLDDDQRMRLGGVVCEIIQQYEDDHRTWISNIEAAWKNYEGEPRVRRRTTPWDGASNVVVPLIGTISDGLRDRIFNQIFVFDDRLWQTRTGNEAIKDFLPALTQFADWISFHDMDLMLPIYDQATEMCLLGHSTIGLSWQHRFVWKRDPSARRDGNRAFRRFTISRGVEAEQIPAENILWDANRDIQKSLAVVRQHVLPAQELIARHQNDEWGRDEDMEEVLSSPGVEGPAESVRQSKSQREGAPQITHRATDEHDIRGVWIDLPALGEEQLRSVESSLPTRQGPNQRSSDVLLYVHRQTQKILWASPDPYLLGRRPFYVGYLRKRPGRASGFGIAKSHDHLQRAQSAQLNQSIDAGTRANNLWMITNNPALQNYKMSMGKMLYSEGGMDSVRELKVDTRSPIDAVMIQLVQSYSERRGNLNDPSFGRELRQGGHPSPATSTLALLDEQRKGHDPILRLYRRELSKLIADAMTMYQSFEADEEGRIERIMGAGPDSVAVKEFLLPPRDSTPINVGVEFDLLAMSPTSNPETEGRRAIQANQATLQNAANLLPMIANLESGQGGPMVQEALKSVVRTLSETHKMLLQALGVDEIEKFTFDVDELLGEGNAQRLRQLRTDLLGAGPGAPASAAQRLLGAAPAGPANGSAAATRRAALGALGGGT